MDKNFGGVIWTNHALERMQKRGIKQGDAWATWRRPDQSRYAKSRGTWVYCRTFSSQKIEVVAKKNEKKEWIILSVWSRPVRREKNKTRSKSKSLLSRLRDFFS
ncbi:DUF4258 domain-containing protein [Patescibacteria group bacterium]|nr:DUF4258 domain-containing protein [Patescibacteria group bacterium]